MQNLFFMENRELSLFLLLSQLNELVDMLNEGKRDLAQIQEILKGYSKDASIITELSISLMKNRIEDFKEILKFWLKETKVFVKSIDLS